MFNNFYLTQLGKNLLAKAQAGTTLSFTKMQMGSGTLAGGGTQAEIEALAALVTSVTNIPISGYSIASAKCTIKGQFTNNSLVSAFQWREIGLFATDPTEGEILYAYAYAPTPETIPAYATTPTEFIFALVAAVSNVSNVTAVIDESLVFATQEQLDNSIIFQTATGTGTAITLTGIELANGYSKTFIVAADNGGAATTINSKPVYKPNTTTAPNLKAGKAVTVWYNLAGDCFFLKASAEGTAVAANVLAGETFSNDDDTGIAGEMTINNATVQNITQEGQEYVIPEGYHTGLGKIKAVITGLIASVIKAGVTVGGILGTFTSDATAATSNIRDGFTAYVNGNKITGTMPDRGSVVITPGTTNQAISNGYHSGAGYVAGDPDLVSTNIKAGANIFGVAGNSNVIDTSAGTATADKIMAGYKAAVDGVMLTGTIVNKGAAMGSITTQNGQYTIGEGYHNGSGKITAVFDNLVAGNVKNGVNIGGVVGTLTAFPTQGFEWTTKTLHVDANGTNAPCYYNGVWVVGCSNGLISKSVNNGDTWTTARNYGSGSCYGSIYAYSKFIMVGGGVVATSPDGTTWTNTTGLFGGTTMYSIAYGSSKLVAGGYSGQIWRSTNGTTWTQCTSPFLTSDIVYSIKFLNNLFVAVAGGRIATSPDGITWTLRASGYTAFLLLDVAYGNGKYIAVGSNGNMLISTDAVTWTLSTFASVNSFTNIIFLNNTFYVSGVYNDAVNIFFISTDAVKWLPVAISNTFSINSLRYENNRLVAGRNSNYICVNIS
jgi:hypothetical protein